mgnify:CR=1 FL=1
MKNTNKVFTQLSKIILLALLIFNCRAELISIEQDDILVRELSDHQEKCKGPPIKDVRHTSVFYKSACNEYSFKKLSKILRRFESVKFKNSYAYSFFERRDIYKKWYITYYTITDNEAHIYKRFKSTREIKSFCKNSELEFCKNKDLKDYILNKSKEEAEINVIREKRMKKYKSLQGEKKRLFLKSIVSKEMNSYCLTKKKDKGCILYFKKLTVKDTQK